MFLSNKNLDSKISSPERPTKRKAMQFESSFNRPSIPNNKRVSFGRNEIFLLNTIPPSSEELDSLLNSTQLEMTEKQQNLESFKVKLESANSEIHSLLTTLKDSMGIIKEISPEEYDYLINLTKSESCQLENLQNKKNELINILHQQEEELLEDLNRLSEQEKSIEKSIKSIQQEDKFGGKQYEAYKMLLGNMGISIKNTDDDYILSSNNSDYTITPTGTSYLITPNHDRLSLFTKGSHMVCKSQLKYLTFRLIDN